MILSVEEQAGVFAVDADATRCRRKMDDHGRFRMIGKETRHIRCLTQIITGAARYYDAAGCLGL